MVAGILAATIPTNTDDGLSRQAPASASVSPWAALASWLQRLSSAGDARFSCWARPGGF